MKNMNVEKTAIDVSMQELAPEENKGKVNLRFEHEKECTVNVRGIFRYHECPGGKFLFSYKKHKWDNIENYDLTDGEVCTIPLAVAKHLNKNCWYPIHADATDANGKPLQVVSRKVQRASFQSMEFIDIEDLTIAETKIFAPSHSY